MRSRTTVLVLLAWLATRALATASVGALPRVLDDVDIYRGWLGSLTTGVFPMDDSKWQYPPGVGPLLVAPDWLPVPYPVSFAALCLAFDLAIMVALLVAHARRPRPSTFGLWLWAAAGLLIGPLLVTRFDVVPAFFAVAAVLLVARPAWSGAAAAAGFLLKLWPALMLLALPRTRTMRATLVFLVVTLALLALISIPFDGALSFLGNQRSRGLQVESTGALPYWLFALVGGRIATGLDYGSMQIDMAGAEIVGTVVTVAGLVVLFVIGWWRMTGRLDRVSAGDTALALVLVMVVGSRVYSPQYNIWVLAIAATATIGAQSRVRGVAWILVGVSICSQVVYPLFPTNFTDGEAWIVLVQALRIGGLLAATVLAVRVLAQPALSAQRATADAAATLSESTPPDMGMRTARSADDRAASDSP